MSNKRILKRRKIKQKSVPNTNIEQINHQLLDKALADGKAYGFCIIVNILHKQFKWGKKRILQLIDNASPESKKMVDSPAVNFVVNIYFDNLFEKVKATKVLQRTHDELHQIYIVKRNDYMLLTIALFCEVLNDKHNFGSKRLDTIMEYATTEYVKINTQYISVADYKIKIEKETNLIF